MSETTDFTAEAIRKALRASGFAPYDPDDAMNPEGFTVGRAGFGSEILVDLRGVDLLPFNPGEGPRVLLGGYVQALDDLGYSVRLASTTVIVAGVKAEPVKEA